MKQLYTSALMILVMLISTASMAERSLQTVDDGANKTFIRNTKAMPDKEKQAQLREMEAWKDYATRHQGWRVEFDEVNGMPHQAYGGPVLTFGSNFERKARNFLNTELADFNMPEPQLLLSKVTESGDLRYAHFTQEYQGLEVLFSRFSLAMLSTGEAINFKNSVHNNIQVSTTPSIAQGAVANYAQIGVDNVSNTSIENDLKVVPIPTNSGYVFKLAYVAWVETNEEIPGKYYTLVDAHDGTVLYRQNTVYTFHDHGHETAEPASSSKMPTVIDLTVEGNVTDNFLQPSSVRGLPYLDVTVNSQSYQLDVNGQVQTPDNSAVSATFEMQGPWARVYTGATGTNMASFTTSLVPGTQVISFDSDASLSERSAYYHTNLVHDHSIAVGPAGFTAPNFQMLVRVDRTDGDCNAFYDGNLNFYAAGGGPPGPGCPETALFHDVVYHEYGHGLNSMLYNFYGGTFNNGALGEGYADVWAFTLTDDPVLGAGFQTTPTSFVRRYDENPKVYPGDLVGEVHADGEIIAGAWWDTYQNMASLSGMTDIWIGSQAAVSMAASGNEGVLYRDILLDALTWDDVNNGGDGDITNGTPNGTSICDGFGVHGVTLISNADLNHTEVTAAAPSQPIDIDAVLNIGATTYLDGVTLFWKSTTTPAWQTVTMTNTSGNNWTGQIPAHGTGELVWYYMGVRDNLCLNMSSVLPNGADHPTNPNIPSVILVGYTLEETEDFDFNSFAGSWQPGLASDDATTGMWELNIPVGSFSNGSAGDTSAAVEPFFQHTPGGQLCMLTEASQSQTAGLGDRDVDGGLTTLESPVLDLSQYPSPAITYHRWYSNNTGANPGNDWWQVHISDDGGTTWTPIEVKNVADNSWRRYAIRVEDHVTASSQVVLRFYASDSLHIGEPLDGGSLVEAALDDIQIWSLGPSSVEEVVQYTELNIYPNPANDIVTINYKSLEAEEVWMTLTNHVGQAISTRYLGKRLGWNKEVLNVESLAAGVYFMKLKAGDSVITKKLTIVR